MMPIPEIDTCQGPSVRRSDVIGRSSTVGLCGFHDDICERTVPDRRLYRHGLRTLVKRVAHAPSPVSWEGGRSVIRAGLVGIVLAPTTRESHTGTPTRATGGIPKPHGLGRSG